jgi:hypothetical protein
MSGAPIIAAAWMSPFTVCSASGFAGSWISSMATGSSSKFPNAAPKPAGTTTAAGKRPERICCRAVSTVYGAGGGAPSSARGAVTRLIASCSPRASMNRRLTSVPSASTAITLSALGPLPPPPLIPPKIAAKIEKNTIGRTKIIPSATKSRLRFSQLMRSRVGIIRAARGR